MKKNHLIAIAALIAAVFTVPFIMTDSKAVQVASVDGSNFNSIPIANFQPNAPNPIRFQSRQNPNNGIPVVAMGQPSYIQPGNRPGVQINWERLEVNGINGLSMYRTPVPGGWLMTTQTGSQKAGDQLVFIPDVIHSWGASQPVYPPSPYGAYPVPRTSRVPQVYPTYPPNPYAPQPSFAPSQSQPNLFVPAQPNRGNPNGAPYSPQQHNPPNFNPQNSFPPGNQLPGNQSPSNTPQFNQPSASNVPNDSMPSTPNVRPQNDSKNQIRPMYYPKTGRVQPSENRNRQPRINRPTPATSNEEYSEADLYFDEMPKPTLNPRTPHGHQSGHQNSLNPKTHPKTAGRYIDDQPRTNTSYAPKPAVKPMRTRVKPSQLNPSENPLSLVQDWLKLEDGAVMGEGAFVIQGDRIFHNGRQINLKKQPKDQPKSQADDSLNEDNEKPVPAQRTKPKMKMIDTKPASSKSVDRTGSDFDQPSPPAKNESND